MTKFLRYLNALLDVVVIGALAVLVVLTFLNVILRYFFASSLVWAVEVSGILFVWIIFLGAVMALRDYGHLGVDLLVAKVPRRAQKVLFTLMNGIIVVLLLMFLDGLISMMLINGWRSGPATPIPVNVMYAAGVVAAVVMTLTSVTQVVRFVVFDTDGPPWAAATTTGAGANEA